MCVGGYAGFAYRLQGGERGKGHEHSKTLNNTVASECQTERGRKSYSYTHSLSLPHTHTQTLPATHALTFPPPPPSLTNRSTLSHKHTKYNLSLTHSAPFSQHTVHHSLSNTQCLPLTHAQKSPAPPLSHTHSPAPALQRNPAGLRACSSHPPCMVASLVQHSPAGRRACSIVSVCLRDRVLQHSPAGRRACSSALPAPAAGICPHARARARGSSVRRYTARVEVQIGRDTHARTHTHTWQKRKAVHGEGGGADRSRPPVSGGGRGRPVRCRSRGFSGAAPCSRGMRALVYCTMW